MCTLCTDVVFTFLMSVQGAVSLQSRFQREAPLPSWLQLQPRGWQDPWPCRGGRGVPRSTGGGVGGAAVLTARSRAIDSRRPVDKDSSVTSDISRESCREYGGT